MSPGSEADVVGKILLVWRLATKDLRHRPAEAFLLLLAIATAAATLTLGLALHGAANNPYAATRAATNGPDVLALESPAASNASGHASLADLTPLEHASGVVAHGGPYLVTWAPLRSPGLTAAAEIQGRSPAPSSVDQPKLTAGSWVRPDGVVVEGGFAQALGLRPGDRISLGRLSFRVAGVAATAAIPNYPQVCYLGCDLPGKLGNDNPGLVWLTKTDAERVAALSGEPVAYVLDLKLKDPAQANDFANAYDADTSPTAAFLASWQTIRDQDATTISNEQLVLLTGSWLLALLALASVIVLVGGRMAGQTRRVGLVKAVGGTPALVATVMLFENVLVAWCAAGVGLLAGRLTAPLLTGPGAGLVGAPGAPALGASAIGLVAAMASGVAVAATFVPAVRAARISTVRALDDAARAPRRRAWTVAISARLPVPLLLGMRLAARRPRRLVLSALSVAVTASGIVAVLIVHQTANSQQGFFAPNNPQNLRLDQVTSVISVMLIVLAVVNAILIAWAMAMDARHSSALARALGASPRQAGSALAVAQVFPALAGALLGIPGGVGLYDVAKHGGSTVVPPVWWLVAVVLGTVVVVAMLTVIPARIGGRRSVAEILQAETA
jgi:ABC-type lipoprotein release transport system permease subunit